MLGSPFFGESTKWFECNCIGCRSAMLVMSCNCSMPVEPAKGKTASQPGVRLMHLFHNNIHNYCDTTNTSNTNYNSNNPCIMIIICNNSCNSNHIHKSNNSVQVSELLGTRRLLAQSLFSSLVAEFECRVYSRPPRTIWGLLGEGLGFGG